MYSVVCSCTCSVSEIRAHERITQVTRHEAESSGMEFEENGIGEECGVFGCVAAGEWPTQLEVAQVLTLGLVALQHR